MTKKYIFNGLNLFNKEAYGVQRFAVEILKSLDSIVSPGQIEVVAPKYKVGEQRLALKNIKVNYIVNNNVKGKKFIWNQFLFQKYVKKNNGISIDLSLNLNASGCDIVAIHDCIRELFPQNTVSLKSKLSRIVYIWNVKNSIKKSRCLITVSEFSKSDIIRLYHLKNDKKIEVIPNAWQHFDKIVPDDSIFKKLGLRSEYFFALGSRNIHKNFKWVVEAAKQNPKYIFIVAGTNILSTSDAFLDDNKIRNLIFTGYLSDGEVKALMSKCKAFIQPSLYEGFGIPPMEAMSVGARCIVSNSSCLPEIYKDSVWYINPLNYDDIDMDKIMSASIKDNSHVLQNYSWNDSAKKLLKIAKELNE